MIDIIRASVNEASHAVMLCLNLAAEEGLPIQDHAYMQLLSEMVSDILAGKRAVWLAMYRSPDGHSIPVGTVQLKLKLDPFFGPFYECGGFYVLPEYRNKKVGRRLLEVALSDNSTVNEDIPVIIVSTRELRQSYKRLGFKPVSTMCMAKVADIKAGLRTADRVK